MSRLFVIEGVDGSGKATQSERLFKRLQDEKLFPVKVTFPDYESDSSVLIKKYLAGEFGKNPKDVSPKIASTFFAADRYASYKTKWGKSYKDGRIIIADRYTTSNMIHQAAKIDDINEKDEFLNWLTDFEYNLYCIPKPDVTIFLDVPPAVGAELTKKRANKFTGTSELDIHESNREYILKSYENSKFIAEKYGWKTVNCIENGKIRTIDDIHEEIYSILKPYIFNL